MSERTYAKITRIGNYNYTLKIKRASEFRRWPINEGNWPTTRKAQEVAERNGYILVSTWQQAEAMEEEAAKNDAWGA